MFINRVTPAMPAHAYKTYQVIAPLKTHFRVASCTEYGCQAQEFGWKTTIDEGTELGQKQAYYIRKQSGRNYKEEKARDGLTVFTFSPGQTCFRTHHVRADRPEYYIVRDGDWRGNPMGTRPRQHSRADFWVEDFAEHQDYLSRRVNG